MKNLIAVRSGFGRVIGVLLIGALFASSAMALTAQQKYWERMGEAENQLDKAYAELGKIDADLAKNKVIDAKNAFNSALKHFDKAVVAYEEATATPEQKEGIKNLKKGLKHMRDAVKSLEINDVETAQSQYDEAREHLLKAEAVLRAPV